MAPQVTTVSNNSKQAKGYYYDRAANNGKGGWIKNGSTRFVDVNNGGYLAQRRAMTARGNWLDK